MTPLAVIQWIGMIIGMFATKFVSVILYLIFCRFIRFIRKSDARSSGMVFTNYFKLFFIGRLKIMCKSIYCIDW